MRLATHLVSKVVFSAVFLLLLGFTLHSRADGQHPYLNRASKAFRAGKVQKAVYHYDQARQHFDSLGQPKAALRAGRLEFAVLLYTPFRDTTKGAVFRNLLKKAKTLENTAPKAYRKTQTMALNVQLVQRSNMEQIISELDALKQAITTKQRPTLHSTVLQALTAKAKLQQGKARKALKLFQESLAAFPFQQKGPGWVSTAIQTDIYFYQGIAYRSLSRYDSALRCLDKGQRLIQETFGKEHPIIARLAYREGKVLRKQSRPLMANQTLNRSLAILEEAKLIYSPLGKRIYREKGNLFSKSLRPSRALTYLEKSLNITEVIYSQSPALIYPHLALGRALKQQADYEKASRHYNKALALARKLPASELKKRRLFTILNNIGDFKGETGKHVAAKKRFESAYQLGQALFPANHPKMADVHEGLMEVYANQNHYHKAVGHARAALNAYKYRLAPQHPRTGLDGYTNRAELARRAGNYDTARLYLRRAYRTFLKVQRPEKASFLPEVYNVEQPQYAFQTSTEHGQLLWDQYQHSGNVNSLSKALSVYQFADSLVNRLQEQYYLGDDNTSLGRLSLRVYPYAVGVNQQLAESRRSSEPDAFYQKQAFYFSEKGKTLQLLEVLSKVRQRQSRLLPDTLQDRVQRLSDTINQLRSKQYQETDDTTEIAGQLVQLKTRKERLLEQLQQTYPDYYAMSFQEYIIELPALQDALEQHNKNLITYTVHDSLLIGMAITPERVVVKELSSAASLASRIKTYRHQMAREGRFDQELSYQLYQQLFQPFEDAINSHNLVIIPDGSIGHLAFGTLARNARAEQRPDYLIESYAFSYSPSASLWKQQSKPADRQEKASGSRNQFIGFAPTFSEEPDNTADLVAQNKPRQRLGSIPGAQEEISRSSSLLRGAMRMGDRATEAAFKELAKKGQILHLATHGIVSDQTPAFNKLLFEQGANSSEDGNLYTHELYNIQMNADLAVLSACNTGYGDIRRGQGHMSLARGFKLAGCENVIMTLWQIKDRVSADLIGSFYKYLAEGYPKSKALQKAKLTYLEEHDPTNRHPHFWGSFVLMGSDKAIQPTPRKAGSPSWLWIVLGGGGLLLLAGIGYGAYNRWL